MDKPMIIQNQSDENQIYTSSSNINPPPLQPNNTPQNSNGPQQYYPPQDVSTPVEKPFIQPQNQFPPPVQPVYPPNQPVAIPVQQVVPVISTPQSNGVGIQHEYQNYQNISEVPHRGIYQTDSNTFYISTGCCFKLFPFIFFLSGFGVLVFSVFDIRQRFIATIIGAIFSLAGIFMAFKMYNNIYFIMGPNTLIVMRKALLGKKVTTYNPGEIEKVDIHYDYSYEHDSEGRGGYMHKYNLFIQEKNGKVETIFNIGSSSPVFTSEEIGYFLYYINTHIRTKMVI